MKTARAISARALAKPTAPRSMNNFPQAPAKISRAVHPAARPPDELAAECDFMATRRSGPGGQNRNKVETAVVLVHRPTGMRAEASERRTQGENRQEAIKRLRIELALTYRLAVPREDNGRYQATPLWQTRCRGSRLAISTRHEDYPALLAEALDVIFAYSDDVKAASRELGCTPSQLIKLLKQAPRALGLVNERRKRAGRHVLR
jgi:hypothetical protein